MAWLKPREIPARGNQFADLRERVRRAGADLRMARGPADCLGRKFGIVRGVRYLMTTDSLLDVADWLEGREER